MDWKIRIFVVALQVGLGWALFDKCYCPGVDNTLVRDTDSSIEMRNLMHSLRREETKTGLPVYKHPVYPAAGVPPANVLANLWPDKPLSVLEDFTLSDYQAGKAALAQAVQDRAAAVAGRRRRKRSLARRARRQRRHANQNLALLRKRRRNTELARLHRAKRELLEDGSYESMLLPRDVVYGIRPVGGDLSASIACVCPNEDFPVPPTSKVHKEVELYTEWSDDLLDLTSSAFAEFKKKTEARLDTLFSSNAYLLEDGYAGSFVIGIKLLELDSLDTSDQLNPTAEDDKVKVIVEIPFAGRENQLAPKRDLDNVMTLYQDETLMTGDAANDAECRGYTVTNISPPSFLQTSVASGDKVKQGQRIAFTCADESKMLPFSFDEDSNFEFEVVCAVDGGVTKFIRPDWPLSCEDQLVCEAVPDPPAGAAIPLVRADDRAKFRVGEHAYFACSNPEAVLDDDSGMNVFELECGASGDFPTDQWPTCVLEPTCNSLPAPPASSGIIKATEGDKVKVGEEVVYTCERWAEYFETPQGPEMYSLCTTPVANNVGTITPISSWPTCEQLPCNCLGKDNGLTVAQSTAVLETSCASQGTYDIYQDSAIDGQAFIIPKRFNCGTYKPLEPSWESRCQCDDLGTPVVVWNEFQILTIPWIDSFGNANTDEFKDTKEMIERVMNAQYMNHAPLMDNGYLRTVVVYFKRGNENTNDGNNDVTTYYTNVIVEHQFKSDSGMTRDILMPMHDQFNGANGINGIFSDAVKMNPSTITTDVYTCNDNTLSLVTGSTSFKVTGNEDPVEVGQSVNVECAVDIQLFTDDRWDTDPDDNVLTIMCKPNKFFDVPLASAMPQCLATCAAAKPAPPAEAKLEIDPVKTSLTEAVWQGDKIYYRCTAAEDGLAVDGPDGVKEGSDESELAYDCDASGQYSIPRDESGQLVFRQCLQRPRRCQCLGDLKTPDLSRQALDLFCRNDTIPDDIVVYQNDPLTGDPLYEVLPTKDRCGSNDPVAMTAESKCHCKSKDAKGADEGVWMNLEVLNIPWEDSLLDLKSDESVAAIYIVQKAMDEMFLKDDFMWESQFVRTKVRKFEKGRTNLRLLWVDRIAESNNTNATDINEIYMEGAGDPYLDFFEPTAAELQAKEDAILDAEINGVEWVEEDLYSILVYVEIQFVTQGVQAVNIQQKMLDDMVKDDWIEKTLWINPLCFTGTGLQQQCFSRLVARCFNEELDQIFDFGFTHSNVGNEDYADQIPVGSTVNLFCEMPNERITSDTFDDDPLDYYMTIRCGLDEKFDLPVKGFPECKSWCPSEKPSPPEETGLYLASDLLGDDADAELWEQQTITYRCNDTTLGIDASAAIEVSYSCVPDDEQGRYAVPRESLNETWPVCMDRTTTVKPPIKTALSIVLANMDRQLIDDETRRLYLSERNAGDENYYVTKLLPWMCLLVFVVMTCLCCTRIDNPWCKYCSRNYAQLSY